MTWKIDVKGRSHRGERSEIKSSFIRSLFDVAICLIISWWSAIYHRDEFFRCAPAQSRVDAEFAEFHKNGHIIALKYASRPYENPLGHPFLPALTRHFIFSTPFPLGELKYLAVVAYFFPNSRYRYSVSLVKSLGYFQSRFPSLFVPGRFLHRLSNFFVIIRGCNILRFARLKRWFCTQFIRKRVDTSENLIAVYEYIRDLIS